MQQKINSLGVGESHSSAQSLKPETPNLSSNLPQNNSQKIKIFLNQIQKDTTLNSNFTYEKTQNFPNETNLNCININNNNNNINIPYDNENINNQFHTGRWTEEEHKKFIEGILEYGNEWKKVQQIIKTRSSTQARSHAQKFFLRVKKIIKNNGGSFNINEKDKILDNIINSILPSQRGETLAKSQKEKLLSAISSNIKYEGENNEHSEDDQQIGLEEENLKFKKENNENDSKFKYHKNSVDIGNLFTNNNIFNQRKNTIGQKRKLSRVDSRDKIFIIQKDISHKTSLDISSQKKIKIENNENNIQNNLNENEQCNKSLEFNKENNCSNFNNNYNNISHNINNNDNIDNKNNMNGCIINNIINVTNNYMNNKYICNFCNNDMINNNYNYNYNYFPDLNFNGYFCEKNDSINYDRNYNSYGFFQCPDKGFNNGEKPVLNGNQLNKVINNNNNYSNNKINGYKENENFNNESNPFELNFNNFNNENYNNNENNENEHQITVQEDEFIKVNNNIEDNIDYN